MIILDILDDINARENHTRRLIAFLGRKTTGGVMGKFLRLGCQLM